MERADEQLIAELCAGTFRPTELPSEIVARGWCQGRFAEDARGRVVSTHASDAVRRCILGAGRKAWRTDHLVMSENPRFCKWQLVLTSLIPKKGSSPSEWQDAPGRLLEEVVALLEEVERVMGLRGVGDC